MFKSILNLCVFLLLTLCSMIKSSSHTESILELYKKISEKGSLNDGLDLNEQTQIKLKNVNTIRVVTLNNQEHPRSNLFVFNISLHRLRTNEDVKLFELRFKLKSKNLSKTNEKLTIFHRQFEIKRKFSPTLISTEQSQYVSFDVTDDLVKNSTEQWLIIRKRNWLINELVDISLVIYSNVPGVFLLPTRSKRSIPSGPCARHDFFVDFDQFSFGEWVVEPKRFNAGICQGDCPNPLSRSYYPTNHAMLLSLLHDRGQIPHQPSCVPVRLRPLDLVYYDRRELVIKRHQGMQVEECGCR